jgi:hypothetical protein
MIAGCLELSPLSPTTRIPIDLKLLNAASRATKEDPHPDPHV